MCAPGSWSRLSSTTAAASSAGRGKRHSTSTVAVSRCRYSHHRYRVPHRSTPANDPQCHRRRSIRAPSPKVAEAGRGERDRWWMQADAGQASFGSGGGGPNVTRLTLPQRRGGVSCYGHRPRSLERRISYADTAPTFSSGVRVTPTPTARSRVASSNVKTASVGPKRVSVNATRTHTDLGGVPRRNAAPLPSITLGRCPSYTDAAPRL